MRRWSLAASTHQRVAPIATGNSLPHKSDYLVSFETAGVDPPVFMANRVIAYWASIR